jgi:hypothetical protein
MYVHFNNTFRNELNVSLSLISGLQKLDGLEGNFVVRTPRDYDPNGNLYDYDLPEHKIFISDWLHLPSDDHFPGLRGANSGQDADSFLINGRGRTLVSDVTYKYPTQTTETKDESKGGAIAQAVSRWLPTAAVRVQTRV